MTKSEVKRHPIGGAFAGLALGIGVALLLVSFSVIALGTLTPVLVMLVGLVLGLVLSLAVPPRGRSAEPVEQVPTAAENPSSEPSAEPPAPADAPSA